MALCASLLSVCSFVRPAYIIFLKARLPKIKIWSWLSFLSETAAAVGAADTDANVLSPEQTTGLWSIIEAPA